MFELMADRRRAGWQAAYWRIASFGGSGSEDEAHPWIETHRFGGLPRSFFRTSSRSGIEGRSRRRRRRRGSGGGGGGGGGDDAMVVVVVEVMVVEGSCFCREL